MKTLILLIIAFMPGICLVAQPVCTDAVHLPDQKKSIINCCIKEIKPDNTVVYQLGGKIYETEAISVNYRGKFYDLYDYSNIINIVWEDHYYGYTYEGLDYEYYKNLYDKATSKMVVGIALATIGGGLMIAGVITVGKNANEYGDDGDYSIKGTGMGATLLGIGGVASGIPLSISGAMKRKKYKRPLDEIRKQASLTLGTTDSGIGLICRF